MEHTIFIHTRTQRPLSGHSAGRASSHSEHAACTQHARSATVAIAFCSRCAGTHGPQVFQLGRRRGFKPGKQRSKQAAFYMLDAAPIERARAPESAATFAVRWCIHPSVCRGARHQAPGTKHS